VARLDAHLLPVEGAARYCYAGATLNTRPAALAASRCPVQVGAELYGYAGVAGDIEVLRLMLDALAIAGCREPQLDLGHVGIFRALARLAGVTGADEATLFDIFQRKAVADLRDFLSKRAAPADTAAHFEGLLNLAGGRDVLQAAETLLAGLAPDIDAALTTLTAVAEALQASHPQVPLYFDLTELRGYHYHTGLVFAAYARGARAEIAKGGRYDAVGEAFGRARPATGFSADLKILLDFYADAPAVRTVRAPAGDDAALRRAIAALRSEGVRVVQALPGELSPGESSDKAAASPSTTSGARSWLRLVDGQWQVDD
jgi:ATP phosphoribosyltransferase regulatory subunit